jgi:hypothetical protein
MAGMGSFSRDVGWGPGPVVGILGRVNALEFF